MLPHLKKWLRRLNPKSLSVDAFVVEANCPALAVRTHLAEAVGVEATGGVLSPILERGRRLPCSAVFTLATSADGQTELSISLYRGNVARAAAAHAIGTFRIEGILPLPRGVATVKAHLASREADLLLEAHDEKSGRPLRIVRVT